MKTTNNQSNLNVKSTFYSKFLKRFFDFTLSLLAIIVLSIPLLIFYLFTIIFNGFPGIYKQARPGKNHKVFYIYKFRSMTNKKDENGKLLPDNQRITWFGKFIRKTSIDELPQLFNILKGDMSIVGPRPRLVKDMVFYDKQVYDYYAVKPGLTGPTQAFGRNKNTWEEVFEKDSEYAQKISFWYDIKIIFFTFFSVFKNTGESHSSSEEDKHKQSKEQEYYYSDYLLRIGRITKEQYDSGLSIAEDIIKNKKIIDYYPELHNNTLSSNISSDEIINQDESKTDDNLTESNETNDSIDDIPADTPEIVTTDENTKLNTSDTISSEE